MTCGEYERAWNERLDARGARPAGFAHVLESHEAECPGCRDVGRRYRILSLAIGAMRPAPAPPVGFARRFAPGGDLAAPAIRPIWARPAIRYAAAALVMAGLVAVMGRRERGERALKVVPVEAASRPLADSLAEATSATWELARATSAPAARIGRDAWGAAPALGVPRLPGGPIAPPSTGSLRGVGDRVHAGVRPLSGSARHAFGFLIAPVLREEGRDGATGTRSDRGRG